MDVGRTSPRLRDFGSLYPKSVPLRKALCEYYISIIGFFRRAVLFSKKNFLSQLSSSVLRPFDAEFGGVREDLQRKAMAVGDEASFASKQVLKEHV